MTGVVLPPSLLAATKNDKKNEKSATENNSEQKQAPMEVEKENQTTAK